MRRVILLAPILLAIAILGARATTAHATVAQCDIAYGQPQVNNGKVISGAVIDCSGLAGVTNSWNVDVNTEYAYGGAWHTPLAQRTCCNTYSPADWHLPDQSCADFPFDGSDSYNTGGGAYQTIGIVYWPGSWGDTCAAHGDSNSRVDLDMGAVAHRADGSILGPPCNYNWRTVFRFFTGGTTWNTINGAVNTTPAC